MGLSLYLGGEKLNRFQIFFTAVLIVVGFFGYNLNVLSAQTSDGSGENSFGNTVLSINPPLSRDDLAGLPDESLMVLGEVSPGEAVPTQGTPSFFVVLRMVLVLALAAAAIYGVVFFFKRLSRLPEQKNPYLKVLANAPLGAGSYVAVVAVGNKAWLVGFGDGGVSPLSELGDQEVVDAMLLDESRKNAEGGASRLLNFSGLLRRLGGGVAGDSRKPSPDSLRKRRERLKDL